MGGVLTPVGNCVVGKSNDPGALPKAVDPGSGGRSFASGRGTTAISRKRSRAISLATLASVPVVVAILAITVASVTSQGSLREHGRGFGMRPAPASVVDKISHVPASVFAEAGSAATGAGPYAKTIATLKTQPAISSDGKPLVDYSGSNWCAYSAATRWPLAVALARFGTFKGLKVTASGQAAAADYPGTSTLSFYGSKYTSRYISFLATEQCSDISASGASSVAVLDCDGYEPLQSLPGIAARLFYKYDFPPYQRASAAGGIPFIDFGDEYVENGAFIDPSVLGNLTHGQIARSLANPVASPGRPILVGANYYSAIICQLTDYEPDEVCESPVVKQAAAALNLRRG